MRSSRMRLLLAVVLALALPVCGGGGSGGSPTAPGAPLPPPGSPPDTSPVSNEALFGKVIGLFDPASNFAGSTVVVSGAGDDTVRSDNSFRIEPVATGEHMLTVRGDGHLKRQVKIEMLAGGANEIPELDLAESVSFDLAAFDEIYREDGESGTARMLQRPHFKISMKDFDSLPGLKGDRLLAAVEAELTGSLKRAVRPFLNGVRMTHENKIDWVGTTCDFAPGDILVFADKDLRSEDGDALWGQAWWCWWPERREVSGGWIALDADAGAGTVVHEAIHILGASGHLKTSGGSLMSTSVWLTDLSSMDERHLRFLFNRPPGLMSPDDARRLGAGDLARLGGRGAGIEVGCQIYADGTARMLYQRDSRFVR